MKIAIYTLPFTWNYGGILQCFALTKTLESQGHKVTVLYQRKNCGLLKKTLKRIKWTVIPLLHKAGLAKANPLVLMESFYARWFNNRSPLFFTSSELKSYCDSQNFDACIVGSDQIWRFGSAQDIYSSFLEFIDAAKTRKIAYAVSFGVDNWEYTPEATERCASLVQDFCVVSTRESSGVDLCRQYLGTEAFHTLDPTLLAGKSLFASLIKDQKSTPGVFYYFLDSNSEKLRMLNTVRLVIGKPCTGHIDSSGKFLSIVEWVGNIANSDFVITDSFHGTCFAILFNKPFVAIYNVKRGNARFVSLLESLGLMDRLVDEHADIRQLVQTPVDYELVNKKLNGLRTFSLSVLDKGLYGTERV